MPHTTSVDDARRIFAGDLLGPEEVHAAFGAAVTPSPIPFSRGELTAAHAAGAMLVLRQPAASDGTPLTIMQLLQRLPDAFDKRFLRQVGYQLKDDWGIELEPLAAADTCKPGWALAQKDILAATRNVAYEEQEAAIHRHAETLGLPLNGVRRRAAVEAVYDTLLYFGARQRRLLEKSWDWSSSRTVDGGYLNVGGFSARGLQVLSFSRAVRHGGLGVCPTCQPLE